MISMKEKARRVIETFPSCHELMNNHGLFRIDKILFKSGSEEVLQKERVGGSGSCCRQDFVIHERTALLGGVQF